MSTKSQEVQKHEDEMDVAENAQHESALGDQYLDGTGLEGVDMTELDGGEAGEGKSEFPAMTAKQLASTTPGAGYLKVNVPPNRYTPLKNAWMDIYNPIVEHMKISIRFDPKKRCVELKTNDATEMPGALQKCADFVKAFTLGFEIRDAIALLRLDDLYIDSFDLKDVKNLHGDHLARAIGRIAGQGGKTRYTIENATKTRVVVADTKVAILGSFQNIRVAKDAIVRLIIGSPPGKVYTQMRNVASRNKTRL